MTVRYTESAATELEAILDYLAERSPSGANAVRDAVLRAVRLLESFPETGEKTDVTGMREVSVPRYPYRLYYAIDPDGVEIIHVRDGRRREWTGGPEPAEDA
jgi:plasmid stabilization system protein ParE